jgi:hypothetical protein
MRYVIIAILLYFVFLFIRRFLRNLSVTQNNIKQNSSKQDKENNPQKKSYDVNMIQDAEFREVKKD